MARDWSLSRDENVFLVYQARMTWTAAAFAAYSPADREQFVQYARHGIAFLDQVLRDKEFGGFHFVLDRLGQVDPKEGDEKHVYGTSFVIYAASKAYEVTGDPLAKRVARDAFDWLERRMTRSTVDTSKTLRTGWNAHPGLEARRRACKSEWTGSAFTTDSSR